MSHWPQPDSPSWDRIRSKSTSAAQAPMAPPSPTRFRHSRVESEFSYASDDSRSLFPDFPRPPSGPYFARLSPVESPTSPHDSGIGVASTSRSFTSTNRSSTITSSSRAREEERLLDPNFINELLGQGSYEDPASPVEDDTESQSHPLVEPVGFGKRRNYVDAPIMLSLDTNPRYDAEPVPYSPTNTIGRQSIQRPPRSASALGVAATPMSATSRFSHLSVDSDRISVQSTSHGSTETFEPAIVKKAIVARRSQPMFAPIPDDWKKWKNRSPVDASKFPDPNTFPMPYEHENGGAGAGSSSGHRRKQPSQSSRSAAKRYSDGVSFKSGVESIMSRVTNSTYQSSARRWDFFRSHPPPPAPFSKYDSDLPLPALVDRANVLSDLMEDGRLPPERKRGIKAAKSPAQGYVDNKALTRSRSLLSAKMNSSSRHISTDRNGVFAMLEEDQLGEEKRSKWSEISHPEPPPPPPPRSSIFNLSRRTLWLSLVGILIFIIVVVVLVTQVAIHHDPHPAGPSITYSCGPGNSTGVLCDLDVTCACTVSSSACHPLSKTLVSLSPIASELFNTNMSVSAVALRMWDLLGTPQQNCSAQVLVVDVGQSIDVARTPQRGQWAQSALLYNVYMSQDLNGTAAMKNYISSLDFSSFSSDGPVSLSSNASTYVYHGAGYDFDFAQLTITSLPVSWRTDANPPATQIAEVAPVAESVLNRMYTFASASSSQQSVALEQYWTRHLQLKDADLPKFVAAVSSSPLLLPFDATMVRDGIELSSMYPKSATNGSFPVPVACYPGLDGTDHSAVNSIESSVFGYPTLRISPTFNTTCIPERPVYGVLDILRQRLPFDDSQSGLPLQAVSTIPDASSRAIIHVGTTLSSFPKFNYSASSPWTSSTTDPRQYGTLSHMNHVILSYLQSLPSPSIASTIVNYVLSAGSATPPLTNSTLDIPLSSIPALEIAFFGTISASDLAFTSSSYMTPSGTLFFGSSEGQTFRDWALLGSDSIIVWTDSSAAAQVVREHAQTDQSFEAVWSGASVLIDNTAKIGGVTNADDMAQVVSAFNTLGYLAP